VVAPIVEVLRAMKRVTRTESLPARPRQSAYVFFRHSVFGREFVRLFS
jgi:hypothetical protein